jgi:hypothetical protein
MASKGDILRGHNSEPGADYEKSLLGASLTVGSVGRALADSKTALAETRKLSEDVDDLDELIADIEKSTAAHTALIKSIEAGSKAMADQVAKLAAEVDSAVTLAKCAAWERGFFERQWAAEVKKGHTRVDLEDYIAAIEESRSEMRKRAERDAEDDGEPISKARFDAQYRVLP